MRATAGQAAVAFWIVLAVAGLGGFAQAVLTASVVPDADLLGRMALAAAGAAVGLALPVGALAGVAGGLRRLSEEGAWLGLRCAGHGGRSLAGPVLAGMGAVAVAWLAVAHVAEPLARAALRDARVAAAARVRPTEGRTLRVGGWAVAVEDGELHFAGGDVVGRARAWELVPAVTGVVVRLADGTLRTPDGELRFGALEAPLALTGERRVHASERVTSDLRAQLARSEALGRDAYERWILWKRTLLPLCLLPLALGAVPLALARRPVAGVVGAQVLTLWGTIRLADQGIGALGPGGAAFVVAAAALAWPLATWAGWSER